MLYMASEKMSVISDICYATFGTSIFPLHNNEEHLSMFTYRTYSPLILCHDFIYRDLDHFTIQEASLSGVNLIYHVF